MPCSLLFNSSVFLFRLPISAHLTATFLSFHHELCLFVLFHFKCCALCCADVYRHRIDFGLHIFIYMQFNSRLYLLPFVWRASRTHTTYKQQANILHCNWDIKKRSSMWWCGADTAGQNGKPKLIAAYFPIQVEIKLLTINAFYCASFSFPSVLFFVLCFSYLVKWTIKIEIIKIEWMKKWTKGPVLSVNASALWMRCDSKYDFLMQ